MYILIVVLLIVIFVMMKRKREHFSLGDIRRGLIQDRLNIEDLEKRYKIVKNRNREYNRRQFTDNRRYQSLLRTEHENLVQQHFKYRPNFYYQYDISSQEYY